MVQQDLQHLALPGLPHHMLTLNAPWSAETFDAINR